VVYITGVGSVTKIGNLIILPNGMTGRHDVEIESERSVAIGSTRAVDVGRERSAAIGSGRTVRIGSTRSAAVG
jgi:hypothetical protein